MRQLQFFTVLGLFCKCLLADYTFFKPGKMEEHDPNLYLGPWRRDPPWPTKMSGSSSWSFSEVSNHPGFSHSKLHVLQNLCCKSILISDLATLQHTCIIQIICRRDSDDDTLGPANNPGSQWDKIINAVLQRDVY